MASLRETLYWWKKWNLSIIYLLYYIKVIHYMSKKIVP